MTSYIDQHFGPGIPGTASHEVCHSWRQFTYRRLEWLYGPERAWKIHNGNDPATQADVQRWNSIGRRSAA